MAFLFLTLPAAVIPGLLLLWWFHRSDRFPEPWPVVRRTFLLGVLIVAPVLWVDAWIAPWQAVLAGEPFPTALFRAFALAAVPEESFKLLVLLAYCARHAAFDEPMDGLVYGVAASLGFATLENILYVAGGGLGVAVTRALTSVPGHALTGAVMGVFVGLALHRPGRRRRLLLLAWLVPVLLHGLYDVPPMYITALRALEPAAPLGLPLLLFALVILLEWRLALAGRRALRALQEDAG